IGTPTSRKNVRWAKLRSCTQMRSSTPMAKIDQCTPQIGRLGIEPFITRSALLETVSNLVAGVYDSGYAGLAARVGFKTASNQLFAIGPNIKESSHCGQLCFHSPLVGELAGSINWPISM